MNPQSPKTRASLVVRLKDARDHEAWTEFTAIYEPLILSLMRRSGLQESDARDVCQQVFVALAKDIEQWKSDGRDASFRRWLFQIARHRVIKFLTSERKRPGGVGGSDAQIALQQQLDGRESISHWFEQEHKQQLLIRAAEQIRGEFRESTWEAFWLSFVEGREIAEVADRLHLSAGSVYVARSRIVARLRSKVEQIMGDEDSSGVR